MGIFDFLIKNKNIENENGLNEAYSNNGKGALEKRFYEKDGMPNGMSQTFYKDGQLEEQSYWKDGLLHGNLKLYHSDGRIRLESYYVNGNLDYIKKSDDLKWKLKNYEKFFDLEILWNKKPLKLTQLLKFDNEKYFNSFYNLKSEDFNNIDKETLIYFIRNKRKFQIEKYITGIGQFKNVVSEEIGRIESKIRRSRASFSFPFSRFSPSIVQLYIKDKILSSDFYGVDISVLREIKTIYSEEKLIRNKTPEETYFSEGSSKFIRKLKLKNYEPLKKLTLMESLKMEKDLERMKAEEQEEEQEKNKKIAEESYGKINIIDAIFKVIDNNSKDFKEINEIFGDIPDELKNELADLKKGILPTKKSVKKTVKKNWYLSKKVNGNNEMVCRSCKAGFTSYGNEKPPSFCPQCKSGFSYDKYIKK